MNKIATIFAVSTLLAATPALSQTYVQGDIGYGAQTADANTRDGNFVLSVATGYDFGSVRMEGGLTSFGQGDNAGGAIGRVDGRVFSVSAYVEPYTYRGFTPYATAGLGYGWFDGGGVNPANKDGVVYNVGAGVSYKVSDRFDLVGGYRYYISDENIAMQDNGTYDNFRQHTVTAGVRYRY